MVHDDWPRAATRMGRTTARLREVTCRRLSLVDARRPAHARPCITCATPWTPPEAVEVFSVDWGSSASEGDPHSTLD